MVDIEMQQKTSPAGNPFFEVLVGDKKYIVVPNAFKSEDNHPDFIGVEDNTDLDELGISISKKWREENGL
jgi:hypothetical protein